MAGKKNKKNKGEKLNNQAKVEQVQAQQTQATNQETKDQQRDTQVKQQTQTTNTTQVKVEQTVVIVQEKIQNVQTPVEIVSQQTPVQRVLQIPSQNPDSAQQETKNQLNQVKTVQPQTNQELKQGLTQQVHASEQVSTQKYTLNTTQQVLIETRNDQPSTQPEKIIVQSDPHIIIPGSAVEGQFEDVHKQLKQKQVQIQIQEVQAQNIEAQSEQAKVEQQIQKFNRINNNKQLNKLKMKYKMMFNNKNPKKILIMKTIVNKQMLIIQLNFKICNKQLKLNQSKLKKILFNKLNKHNKNNRMSRQLLKLKFKLQYKTNKLKLQEGLNIQLFNNIIQIIKISCFCLSKNLKNLINQISCL